MLYAVHKGHQPGVFSSWVECKHSVNGFKGAKYRKFTKMTDAKNFVKTGKVDTVDPTSVDPELQQAFEATATPNDGLDPLIIYTDGSCGELQDTGATIACSGIWYGPDDPRNRKERVPGVQQTNNRAELWAAIRAIETLECPHDQHVVICTDSRYTINAVCKWIEKWQHSNWRQKTVKNEILIKRLHKLATGDRPISFIYTPGHRGIEGNEGADKLADFSSFSEKAEKEQI